MTDYNDPGQPTPQGQPAPTCAPQQPAAGAPTPGAAQPAGAAAPVGGSAQQADWQGQAPAGAAPSGWQAQPGAGGTMPPQPQSPYAAAPVPPQPQPVEPQPVYAEGCLKAAWRDISSSEGWKGRMALLGLIGCVPILNFMVYGYSLNWSREVPFGAKTPLPREVVNGRNFEYGFYYFLIALVIGLVASIASAVVGWVPLIGWVAAIAIMLFAGMLETLLSVRMAMMGSLGEGFQIGHAWSVLKRNWTSLLGAAVVPNLIMGAVVSIVGFVFMAIGLVGFMGPLMALISGYGSAAVATAAGGMGLVGMLLMLVWCVLCAAGWALATVVSMRAVAHWVGRNAPEWAADAWRASQMRY